MCKVLPYALRKDMFRGSNSCNRRLEEKLESKSVLIIQLCLYILTFKDVSFE